MEQFVEGKNPYTILGLEQGQKSTLDEIKKAYRRLALVKHPDKAKTPNAAQEFDELKKAYAILSDKAARAALDEYLSAQKAREERLSKQDAKRQRMREDLERREKSSARSKNEEEVARAKLKEELEALRNRVQQAQHDKQQAAKEAAAARAASNAAAALGRQAEAAADEDDTTQLLMRTVKVSWDPTIGNYTTDRLRQMFQQHWKVEDVMLKDSRKQKKAQALVVLSSILDAERAAQEVHGDMHNPLLVTPYLKVMPAAGGQSHQQQQGGAVAAAGPGATGQSSMQPEAGQPAGKQQPLFASGLAGATSRQVQRPSKPLFPGARPQQPNAASDNAVGDAAAGQAAPSSCFPAAPEQQQGQASSSKFSSFPAAPPLGPNLDGTAAGSSKSKFGSFPGMPGAEAPSNGSKYSSFPGSFPASFAPAGGAAGASAKSSLNSTHVGGSFENAVLEKLQQKKAGSSERQQQ